VQPAPYLLAQLGRPPRRPLERQAWRRAARRIEGYRFDHGVRDQDAALGPRPVDSVQRAAFDRAMAQAHELARPGARDHRELGHGAG
jgi:hypothetical protein